MTNTPSSATGPLRFASSSALKQLVLDRPPRQWMDQALGVSGLLLAELTPAILLDSCELPQPFHGDPADQLIVASARHHAAVLVTRDQRLRSYAHVQTAW